MIHFVLFLLCSCIIQYTNIKQNTLCVHYFLIKRKKLFGLFNRTKHGPDERTLSWKVTLRTNSFFNPFQIPDDRTARSDKSNGCSFLCTVEPLIARIRLKWSPRFCLCMYREPFGRTSLEQFASNWNARAAWFGSQTLLNSSGNESLRTALFFLNDRQRKFSSWRERLCYTRLR